MHIVLYWYVVIYGITMCSATVSRTTTVVVTVVVQQLSVWYSTVP